MRPKIRTRRSLAFAVVTFSSEIIGPVCSVKWDNKCPPEEKVSGTALPLE